MPMNLSLGLGLGGIPVSEGVGVPAWVLSGAALDLDFAEVQGYNSLDRSKLTPDSILTYTSPSPKMVYGDDGVLFSSSGTLPYDHDPVTFAPLGVLIEEQRTNLTIYSGDYSNAAWSGAATSKTSGQTDVLGGTGAGLVTADGSSALHTSFNGSSVNYTSGTTYAFSRFVKAGTQSLLQLIPPATAFGATAYANFDLSGAGSITQSAGLVASGIEALAGGWYRAWVSVTATASVSASSGSLAFISTTTDARGPTNTLTTNFYDFGGQVEAGAFPTSYIPTVASQVTRAADQVSMLTSAFAYNQSAGTVVVEGDPIVRASGASGFFAINISGGNNNTYNLYRAATTDELQIRSGGSTVALINIAGPTGVDKFAVGWMVDDFAISKNGAAVSTDTAGALPVGVTTLQIGTVAGGNYANGHIERLTYFPTRKTNAELQVLST